VKTSSTSGSDARARRGSRALPWAGLLAAALLLAGDRLVLGPDGPWQWFVSPDPHSTAATRLALKELRAAPPGAPRVAVVGTSMVLDGFDPEVAARRMPGVHFAKLAHPRFEPFVLLQLVDELVAARVDAVVLVLCELDTHRPLRLEPVPGASGASLAALVELLRATDLRFAFENRTSLYRLLAASAAGMYRFRADLALRVPPRLREFAVDARLGRPGRAAGERPEVFRPAALWDARHNAVPVSAQRHTFDLFPPQMDQFKARLEAGTLQEITAGHHAVVQQRLLRRAIEKLREAGIQVVIVQGVMHPASQDYYDPALREAAAEFCRSLARELGAHFVPASALEPLAESDFYDVIHVNRQGAAKMTRGMLVGLRRAGVGVAPGAPTPAAPAAPTPRAP
jgi:hypothetical protein